MVSNLGSFNPTQAANQVAELFLAGKMTDPPAPKPDTSVSRTFITLEPSSLQPFVGTYPLPAIGQTLETAVDRGKLWAVLPDKSRFELKAVGSAHFYVGELTADIEFTAKPGGGMTAKITQPGAVNTGDREAPVTVKPDLTSYEGVYWSEELEAEYTILVRDGSLFAVNSHHGEFALTPSGKDRFRSPKFFFQDVSFVRDDKAGVIALTVGGGRVTAIRFDRNRHPKKPDDKNF